MLLKLCLLVILMTGAAEGCSCVTNDDLDMMRMQCDCHNDQKSNTDYSEMCGGCIIAKVVVKSTEDFCECDHPPANWTGDGQLGCSNFAHVEVKAIYKGADILGITANGCPTVVSQDPLPSLKLGSGCGGGDCGVRFTAFMTAGQEYLIATNKATTGCNSSHCQSSCAFGPASFATWNDDNNLQESDLCNIKKGEAGRLGPVASHFLMIALVTVLSLALPD